MVSYGKIYKLAVSLSTLPEISIETSDACFCYPVESVDGGRSLNPIALLPIAIAAATCIDMP